MILSFCAFTPGFQVLQQDSRHKQDDADDALRGMRPPERPSIERVTIRSIVARVLEELHLARGFGYMVRLLIARPREAISEYLFEDRTRLVRPVRRGKGKGNVEYWVAPIQPGRVLYEIQGVTEEQAREAFRLASAKLAVKTTFVKRSVL